MLGKEVVVEELRAAGARDEDVGARKIGELGLEEGMGLMKGIDILL